ncbi:acetylxylan esterase [Neiella marina]|uniref:Acetylxylan esterase n=1 Tax=Neiella marina TaxID=508461 RepID=A0A8J2U6R0_9GAMM|nr:SGNH/GDSL hydrolase family protein [Neiella marina]GGA82492.1 acetylxylan esterase [Neiella marina]
MHQLTLDPAHSTLHYCGRFDRSVVGKASHSWPYTGIHTQLKADKAVLQLNCERGIAPVPSYYDVFIDGQWLRTLCCKPGQQQYVLFDQTDQLPSASFELAIHRRSESLTGVSHFLGIDLYRSEAVPSASKPKSRQRKIEFYGDSISCGYGNETNKPGYDPAKSNACKAFPALVAKRLDADVSVVAYSGEGIYRRFDGNENFSLPNIAQRSHLYSDSDWLFPDGPADAVVINLGTNDFVPGIADKQKFVTAYTEFVQTQAKLHPFAPIFVVLAPNRMVDNWREQASYLEQVVNDCQSLNINIHFVEVATLVDGLSGSDDHPNLAQQQLIADVVADALVQILNIERSALSIKC